MQQSVLRVSSQAWLDLRRHPPGLTGIVQNEENMSTSFRCIIDPCSAYVFHWYSTRRRSRWLLICSSADGNPWGYQTGVGLREQTSTHPHTEVPHSSPTCFATSTPDASLINVLSTWHQDDKMRASPTLLLFSRFFCGSGAVLEPGSQQPPASQHADANIDADQTDGMPSSTQRLEGYIRGYGYVFVDLVCHDGYASLSAMSSPQPNKGESCRMKLRRGPENQAQFKAKLEHMNEYHWVAWAFPNEVPDEMACVRTQSRVDAGIILTHIGADRWPVGMVRESRGLSCT